MAEKTISIADKPTLDKVKELLENGSIADKTTVDAVKSLLENSTYGLSALKSLLSSGNSVVKSVQRGVSSLNTSSSFGSKTITLNKINPNKSIFFIQGGETSYTYNGNTIYENNPWNFYGELAETALKIVLIANINTGNTLNCTVNWQVIEFY